MNVFLWQSILLAAIAIVASLVVVPRLVETYRGFRGRRFVLCPETRLPAEVKVNAALAVLSTALAGGRPCPRLSECSRWPERRNCGQECLAQVEASPEGCLVRSIVQDLYAGTTCAFCGRRLGEFRWYEHYPAALSPGGVTVEWNTNPARKTAGGAGDTPPRLLELPYRPNVPPRAWRFSDPPSDSRSRRRVA